MPLTVTLDTEDTVKGINAAAGNTTVNLPAVSTVTKKTYWIKKIDSSANTVTIDPDGSETIDGASTLVLSSQWDYAVIISTGTTWWRIG